MSSYILLIFLALNTDAFPSGRFTQNEALVINQTSLLEVSVKTCLKFKTWEFKISFIPKKNL